VDGVRADRLLSIILILSKKAIVTGKELAEHFDVSVRTIYRDIDKISQAGIPVAAIGGKSGGFYIMENYKIDKLCFNSYLNVRESDLIEKVVLCWQSLWNERAIEYRAKYNVKTEFSHGVVIQEMIKSKLSGVIFTANPINGIRNEILINASYGLGEAIVSGKVNPDQYIIDKMSGKALKNEISSKEIVCQYTQDGIEYVPAPEKSRRISSLKENHIRAIVEESVRIEDYFGKPQDIEFAFDDNDKLFVVQSRQITTLFPIDSFEQDGKLRAYLSVGTVLLGMKEPFTPLGFDIFSQMFPSMINIMTMQKKPLDNSFVKYAGYRIYVDITYLLSNNFASKQFANTFSDNDLPLKNVMLSVIDKHSKTFKNQGIRFKIPWGGSKIRFEHGWRYEESK